jgi:hypothetical protein
MTTEKQDPITERLRAGRLYLRLNADNHSLANTVSIAADVGETLAGIGATLESIDRHLVELIDRE